VKRSEEEEGIIKSVILVLMNESATHYRSDKNQMDKIVEREMAHVRGLKAKGVYHDAIEQIIARMRVSQSVVDFTVEKYLDLYNKSIRKSFKMGFTSLFEDTDSLAAAAEVAKYGVSKGVAENLVGVLARHGWICAEDVAQDCLHRGLTSREVLWIIESYCKDKASRNETFEEDLKKMAKKYCSKIDMQKALSKIDAFVKCWESTW
jgi:hypothetical protein